MTDTWSERADMYRESEAHREGEDLDVIVEWAEGKNALDVATGGGHVARRLSEAGFDVTTLDPAPGMGATVVARLRTSLSPTAASTSSPAGSPRIISRTSRRLSGRWLGSAATWSSWPTTSFSSETVEEAEKLRDPTHVRCYSEDEWR